MERIGTCKKKNEKYAKLTLVMFTETKEKSECRMLHLNGSRVSVRNIITLAGL